MSNRRSLVGVLWALTAFVWSLGCGDPAGMVMDGGSSDSHIDGLRDGGGGFDAGTDGEIPDARLRDAREPDAGMDAGEDSGADAGVADAATGDSGTRDSGPDIDASSCACASGLLCADGLCVPDISMGAMQRMNLPGTPASPRFAVPPARQWPTSVDSPTIALWHDDALAAVSVTIDDNSAPDHPWWSRTAAMFGIPLTWFVITDNVGMHAFDGTWPGWQSLSGAGHSIQSHGAIPGNPRGMPASYWLDTYTRSIDAIQMNISAEPADVIGHPWGVSHQPYVEDLFIAGRGTQGRINRAAEINYLNTGARSRGLERSYIDSLLGSGPAARGWYIVIYHTMTPALQNTFTREMDYIRSRSADFWVGTFRDVARYGQERDTARLVVHEANAEHVVLSLSDEMEDGAFDHPLTVKVRLPPSWRGAIASQGGPAPLRVASHAGERFALVDVIPDQGPVVLRDAP